MMKWNEMKRYCISISQPIIDDDQPSENATVCNLVNQVYDTTRQGGWIEVARRHEGDTLFEERLIKRKGVLRRSVHRNESEMQRWR